MDDSKPATFGIRSRTIQSKPRPTGVLIFGLGVCERMPSVLPPPPSPRTFVSFCWSLASLWVPRETTLRREDMRRCLNRRRTSTTPSLRHVAGGVLRIVILVFGTRVKTSLEVFRGVYLSLLYEFLSGLRFFSTKNGGIWSSQSPYHGLSYIYTGICEVSNSRGPGVVLL